MKTVNHDEWLTNQLQNAEFAAEFINAASEDDDSKTYLTALSLIFDASASASLSS